MRARKRIPSHYGDDQDEEEGNYDGEETDGDDDYDGDIDEPDDASDDVRLPLVPQLDEFTDSKGLDAKRSFRQ